MDTVSIFIVNYNGENVLRETIQSLKNQDYPEKSITLIDDCSTDRSVAIIRNEFPDIEIVGLSYNSGYPNKLRRLAAETAKTRFVFLVDNDIALKSDCLSKMIKAVKSQPDIGLCTPRLMYYNNRKRIYVCWTKFHYLCASISPLRDTDTPPESHPIDTLGGGTMLLDKKKLNKIGTIDDSYPMGWGEDAEIYARMKIAGFRSVYVPGAVGFHHAKEFLTERSPRAFGQVRNRWFMILSMYEIKTIILIMPALFLYELLTFLMLIPKKLPGTYIRSMLYTAKNIKIILQKRKQIQATRKVKDKQFLTSGTIHIPKAYLSNPLYEFGINYLNKIFNSYWQITKTLL